VNAAAIAAATKTLFKEQQRNDAQSHQGKIARFLKFILKINLVAN
jgi:hypothetical protein